MLLFVFVKVESILAAGTTDLVLNAASRRARNLDMSVSAAAVYFRRMINGEAYATRWPD